MGDYKDEIIMILKVSLVCLAVIFGLYFGIIGIIKLVNWFIHWDAPIWVKLMLITH